MPYKNNVNKLIGIYKAPSPLNTRKKQSLSEAGQSFKINCQSATGKGKKQEECIECSTERFIWLFKPSRSVFLEVIQSWPITVFILLTCNNNAGWNGQAWYPTRYFTSCEVTVYPLTIGSCCRCVLKTNSLVPFEIPIYHSLIPCLLPSYFFIILRC